MLIKLHNTTGSLLSSGVDQDLLVMLGNADGDQQGRGGKMVGGQGCT